MGRRPETHGVDYAEVCHCDFGLYCLQHPHVFLDGAEDETPCKCGSNGSCPFPDRCIRGYDDTSCPCNWGGACSEHDTPQPPDDEPLNPHDPLNSMCDCAACLIKNASKVTPLFTKCIHGRPFDQWCPPCDDVYPVYPPSA